MKRLALVVIAGWLGGAMAAPLTVSERNIAGKTALVLVAEVMLKGHKATILTDDKGMSLYTFAIDKSGVSNCSGGCLKVWPPEHVPAGTAVAAPFATIKG